MDEDENEQSIWASDVEKAFEDAMTIYPSVGRRKICIDGSMYGRNELIARHIKQITGKVRTRKQVSSHIQARAKKTVKMSGPGVQGMSSTEILANLITQGRGGSGGGSTDSEGSPMHNPDHHKPRRFEDMRISPVGRSSIRSPRSRAPGSSARHASESQSSARRSLLPGQAGFHGEKKTRRHSSPSKRRGFAKATLTKGDHDAAHILGSLQRSCSKRPRFWSDSDAMTGSTDAASSANSNSEDADGEHDDDLMPYGPVKTACKTLQYLPPAAKRLHHTTPGGSNLEACTRPTFDDDAAASSAPAAEAIAIKAELQPHRSSSGESLPVRLSTASAPTPDQARPRSNESDASALLAFASSPTPFRRREAVKATEVRDLESQLETAESAVRTANKERDEALALLKKEQALRQQCEQQMLAMRSVGAPAAAAPPQPSNHQD